MLDDIIVVAGKNKRNTPTVDETQDKRQNNTITQHGDLYDWTTSAKRDVSGRCRRDHVGGGRQCDRYGRREIAAHALVVFLRHGTCPETGRFPYKISLRFFVCFGPPRLHWMREKTLIATLVEFNHFNHTPIVRVCKR